MKIILLISLILNLIIVGCEIYTLSNIKRKINILKYYTFVQNLLALITSIIYSICLIISLISNNPPPEFARGLRYVATSGLVATMLIYVVFLSKNSKNIMSEEDFKANFNPKKANFILHYFCPIISLISFVLFEREIVLNESVWTGYAAIPSCLYWIIYGVLSVAKLWEEPYDFSRSKEKKNIFSDILIIISIPISFILITYILWNIK